MNKMKTWAKRVTMVVLMLAAYIQTTAVSYADVDLSRLGKATQAFSAFFDEYRIIMGYITGFGTLTSILIFIFHMIQLANLSSHPIKRRQAFQSIMVSMVCTALLGGLTTINFLFYDIIFKSH